jgi:CBS domain-containing protein
VYDYKGGKLDWLAFGLPSDGSAAEEPTIGERVRADAPTCRPEERLGDLAARMSPGWSWCVVLNDAGVVLGRVRRQQVDESPEERAVDVMGEGPSTYRPSLPAAEMVEAMKKGGFEHAIVTDSDGRFLGLVTRQDLDPD